jgi:hypothetical protein
MPNRFRVLDCIIERTGDAESVSRSLSESESESESNPLIDQSSQLDTNPSFRPRHRLSIQKPGSACFSETADFDSLALAPLRLCGESRRSLKVAPRARKVGTLQNLVLKSRWPATCCRHRGWIRSGCNRPSAGKRRQSNRTRISGCRGHGLDYFAFGCDPARGNCDPWENGVTGWH